MREEFKKLKTQRKNFDEQKCSNCSNLLGQSEAIHFMCGHSFHEGCLHKKECLVCQEEFQRMQERSASF